MNAIVGPLAKRLHLLLMIVVVLCGLPVLLLIAAVMVSSDDYYSRDMGILALIITAPLWIPGLIAAAELIRAMRGRPVSVARAGVWALATTVGAATFAYVLGRDNFTGAGFMPLDQPTLLLPIAVLGLGVASLIAVWRERRRRAEVEPAAAPAPAADQ